MSGRALADAVKRLVNILAKFNVEPWKEPHHYSSADVIARDYKDDAERLTVWYLESLLHGCQSVQRGNWTQAQRSYIQAVEYRAKTTINDYQLGTESPAHELSQALEQALKDTEAKPKCAIGWIDCHCNPTWDDNDAIGMAVFKTTGERIPICSSHYETLGVKSHHDVNCNHGASTPSVWTFELYGSKR